MFKRTKILATIGPASATKKTLRRMLSAGMNCARINTAHGEFEQYKSIIRNIRDLRKIPILIDIKGPEIRFKTKETIKVTKKEPLTVYFDQKKYPHFSYDFYKKVKIKDTIYFDNGNLKGTVTKKKKQAIEISFSRCYELKANKGVNLPGKRLGVPSLSRKDKQAINFAKKHSLAFIALSFVRNKKDVTKLRKRIKDSNIGIIAKIENEEGLSNIDEIIQVSDGVMIARGDLGIEVGQEKLPCIQKSIIKKCNNQSKIAIVATQMLESMIEQPIPTRAEVSDVANAILDGADAVMLSGETAIGKHPVLSVETMKHIAHELDQGLEHHIDLENHGSVSEDMSKSLYNLALRSHATKIVCLTRSGFSARLVSRFRLPKDIIAVTDDVLTTRRLQLVWGVKSVKIPRMPFHGVTLKVAKYLYKQKLLTLDDTIIFFGSFGKVQKDTSNFIELHNMRELLRS